MLIGEDQLVKRVWVDRPPEHPPATATLAGVHGRSHAYKAWNGGPETARR